MAMAPYENQKILVTGASGAAGSYMLEYLVQEHPNNTYIAIIRDISLPGARYLKSLPDNIRIETCNLLDFDRLATLIKRHAPDFVYHFASDADVKESFLNPREVLTNNISSTINLFDAIRRLETRPRVLLASTSEVYGQVEIDEVPITETNQLRPASPYAVSKTTQDLLANVYWQAYNIPIIRSRMFTYINPRRENLFATSFAMQVARIESGLQHELLHGNLKSVRTHIDIRDVVRAYFMLMSMGTPGEAYNIGGIDPFTVGDFLQILKSKALCDIVSREDERLIRPVDVTLQVPDISKFTQLTGWRPQYSLEESIEHLLAECRLKVATSLG